MGKVVNWVGLAAGAVTVLLLLVSLFAPWWQLYIGDGLVTVNASPIYTNFGLFGAVFLMPLITAFNVATVAILALSASAILIYSLNPTKSYAKTLLDFSYKKPLYAIIAFLAGLIVVTFSLHFSLNIDIPLFGADKIVLPQSFTGDAAVSANVNGAFQWPFVLAVAAAVLSVAAKFTHKRTIKALSQPTIPETATA
jgi:hypothetical protein